MYKVKNYSQYNEIAKEIKCGTVYPLSMTQGYQSGEAYTDGKAMLFHHDCGFAFLCGDTEETFLNDVYSLMKRSQRRFVLFSEKEYITRYFKATPHKDRLKALYATYLHLFRHITHFFLEIR